MLSDPHDNIEPVSSSFNLFLDKLDPNVINAAAK